MWHDTEMTNTETRLAKAAQTLTQAKLESNPMSERVRLAFDAGYGYLLLALSTRYEVPDVVEPSRNVLGLSVSDLGVQPAVLAPAAKFVDYLEVPGGHDGLLPGLLRFADKMRELAADALK